MTGRVFEHEIKCMMYSFGDARHPSSESAALVEEVVHKQLKEIISQSSGVTNMRGARSMSVEDIMFLLRKDKDKIRRIVRHLQMRDMAKKAGSSSTQNNSEDEQNDPYLQASSSNKKRKYSLSFLSAAHQSEINDADEMDEVQLERLQRQDALTMNMDVDEYLKYSECRLMNFHKNTTKFKEWLGFEQRLNQEVVEVLGYLAYEALREIVELSLLVKLDMGSVTFDPCSSFHLGLPDPNTPSEFGSTPTFFTTPAAPQSSTSGGSPSGTSPTAPVTPQPVATTSSRGRKRKRKSDGPTPQPPAAVVDNQDNSALQPTHIREALRRCHNTLGPLSPFAAHTLKASFSRRTLCI